MENNILYPAVTISAILLTMAMGITVVRLFIGPSHPDRLVALDLIASISIAIIILLAISGNNASYLDIAVFIAMIAFIGTVAISKFLKRKSYDK